MNEYSVKVKHDKGIITFKVMADDVTSARKTVCQTEGCPERAIMSVVEKKRKQYRTVRTKVYKFEGLTEEGKEEAIKKWRTQIIIDQDFPFIDEYQESLKKFMDIFPVENGRRGDLLWDERIRHSDEIRELKGKRLVAYLWNHYGHVIYKPKFYYHDGRHRHSKCQVEYSCPLTGMGSDHALLDPIVQYISSPSMWHLDFEQLMDECESSWEQAIQKEEEYRLSDESIREEINANEYEFLADGTPYA